MATVTVNNRKFDVTFTPHATLANSWVAAVTPEDGQPYDDIRQDIVSAAWAIDNPPAQTTTEKS
jgi:hypothetical protein